MQKKVMNKVKKDLSCAIDGGLITRNAGNYLFQLFTHELADSVSSDWDDTVNGEAKYTLIYVAEKWEDVSGDYEPEQQFEEHFLYEDDFFSYYHGKCYLDDENTIVGNELMDLEDYWYCWHTVVPKANAVNIDELTKATTSPKQMGDINADYQGKKENTIMTDNTHSTGTQLSLEELLTLSGIPNTAKPDTKEASLFEARFVNGQVELTPVKEERESVPVPTPVPASVPSPIHAPTGRKVCRISESVIRRILADKMDSPKVPDLSIIYSVADKSAAEMFYKDIFFYGEMSLIEDLQESLKELHISFKLVVPTDLGFAEYIIAVNGKVKPANDLASPVVAEAASKKLMAPAGGGFTVVFKTTGKDAWFHDFKNMEEVSAYLGKKGFAELVHYKDIYMKGGVSFAKVGPYLTVDEKKNYTFKK